MSDVQTIGMAVAIPMLVPYIVLTLMAYIEEVPSPEKWVASGIPGLFAVAGVLLWMGALG